MRLRIFPIAASCVAILLSGCSLAEKYSKNNAVGEAWLAAGATRSTASNFEGVYYSPDWGMVALNQEGTKITGALSHYNIRGKASGKTAYLLLVDDQWIEYTMVLSRKSSEVLTGSYSASVPFSKDDAEPVHLDRIED